MSKTPLKSAAEIAMPPTEPSAPQPEKLDVRDRLASVPAYHVGIHTRMHALRDLVIEAEKRLVQSFIITQGGESRHYGNAVGPVHLFCQADFVQEYITRREVLRLVEASDEYKAAEAIMQPLLAELAELEAKEEADRLALSQKQHALNDAREAAKARALEAAEEAPEVVAARRALEALS